MKKLENYWKIIYNYMYFMEIIKVLFCMFIRLTSLKCKYKMIVKM